MLKSLEAGENVSRMSRIEVMYHDGDVLSIGLRCDSEDDTSYFRMLLNFHRKIYDNHTNTQENTEADAPPPCILLCFLRGSYTLL